MILPFSTHFSDDTPTRFVEKIWAGIRYNDDMNLYDALYEGMPAPANFRWWNPERYQPDFHIDNLVPKIHTIRADTSKRWRAGAQIHPVLFNRTPHIWVFAWMRCTDVQDLFMRIEDGELRVWADLRRLAQDEVDVLAANDGFDSYQQFHNWFAPLIEAHPKKCWRGRIIHWSDIIRY